MADKVIPLPTPEMVERSYKVALHETNKERNLLQGLLDTERRHHDRDRAALHRANVTIQVADILAEVVTRLAAESWTVGDVEKIGDALELYRAGRRAQEEAL